MGKYVLLWVVLKEERVFDSNLTFYSSCTIHLCVLYKSISLCTRILCVHSCVCTRHNSKNFDKHIILLIAH